MRRKGYNIYQDDSEIINAPLFADATELTKQLLTRFEKGEIGEIYLAYTNFKNTVTQEPRMIKLLPINPEDFDTTAVADEKLLMNFEPDDETVLDRVIPKYMSNIIFRIKDESILYPEYLMMWFSRDEFKRFCWFHAFGSARDSFEWSMMKEVQIPIPDISIQKEIVTIHKCYLERQRIASRLNEILNNLSPILIKGSLQTNS